MGEHVDSRGMTRCCYILVPHRRTRALAMNGQTREGEPRWAQPCLTSFEIRHWSTSFAEWWGSSSGDKWATAGRRLIRRGARRWNEARIEGSTEWMGCRVLYFIHLIQRIAMAMFCAHRYGPCHYVTMQKAVWCMSPPYPGSPGFKIWPWDLPLWHIFLSPSKQMPE